MKIAIDLDEVIVEFVRHFLDFYNQKNKTEIKFEDWTSYNFSDIIGCTLQEHTNLIHEFQRTSSFNNLRFLEGAKEAINKLNEDNEIIILTSRAEEFKKETENFLKKHFPEENLEIIYSGDVYKNHKKTKAELCKDLKIDCIIEDHKKYAEECADCGVKVLLLDKPWNKEIEHKNICRVYNWKEILEKLKGEK